MTVTISVGSGKGGTGKSTVITNLAMYLASTGRKVCIADLDVGGPDLHILLGLFEPRGTLTDFLTRKENDITNLLHTFDSLHGLQLLPGTGDTLQTANMTYQEKQRVIRALSTIDTDVLFIDVGAGTSYHVLDFFMLADIQICTILPEPTAIMDFYNFLQLATIRKALGSFLSQSQVSSYLKKNSFSSLTEVFQMAEDTQEGARRKAQDGLRYFHPLLLTNRTSDNARLNKLKLQKMTKDYLGISLPDLGDIPEDPMVPQAVKSFLPVVEFAPESSSSKGYIEVGEKLGKVIDLYKRKQQS